jgi:glycosyltransferase involved in cell wall biosynthesis
VRIAHSHNDTSRADESTTWRRRCYLRWAKNSIQRNATCLAAVSKPAARALFGESWPADPRSRLQRCGIDLAPYRSVLDRRAARAEWGVETGEFLIGHVGRFDVQKNHSLLVEIAAEVIRQNGGTKVLMVGDGPRRASIEESVRKAGIAGRVAFAGVRSDVPRILCSVDVLVFPSLWEGLPLTVLEAQAAGLPCVISDVITDETDVVPELIYRVPLSSAAEEWARVIRSTSRATDPASALESMEQSTFSISRSIEQLYALYDA